MKDYFIFLLRIALGIGFLSAVADRMGYWGQPGDLAVTWGNWENFVLYTSKLNFGINQHAANILGLLATISELILGMLLVLGIRVKYTSLCSGVLLLIFALFMSFNTHVKYALDYSVFVAAFGAFLLSTAPKNKWSIDRIIDKDGS